MKNLIRLVLLVFALGIISSCSATKGVAAKKVKEVIPMGYVGAWDVTISDTPAGTITAELTIDKKDGAYSGFFISDGNKMNLDNISVEGGKLSTNFYSAQYGVDVSIATELEEGDTRFSGWVMNDFKITGTRKVASTEN